MDIALLKVAIRSILPLLQFLASRTANKADDALVALLVTILGADDVRLAAALQHVGVRA